MACHRNIHRRIGRAFATAAVAVVAANAFAQANVPVVAVGGIESPYRDLDTDTIRTAMESALSKTRKFKIMERARLDTLLEERGLSVTGIADGTASYGGFSGVDYLVTGRVMDAGTGSASGSSIPILGAFAGGCEAIVELDVRVVDVGTGEIRFSENVAGSDRIRVDYPENADYGDSCRYAKRGQITAALGNVAQSVAVATVEKITMALFPIRVVRVVDGQAYLNYGSTFLSNGNYLRVVTLGEGFVDPDTGEVLGADEEDAGFVVVTDTRPKYSVSDVVYATRPFQVGDVARQMSRSEGRAVKKMLADRERARAKRESACRRAEKSRDRSCEKNENSSRCRRALASIEDNC